VRKQNAETALLYRERFLRCTITCGVFLFGGSGNPPTTMALPLPPHMNQLFVGLTKQVEPPTRGLFIDDDVPDISRARIFDPTKHSFNPLKDIDYRKARALADVLYTAYPLGDNTLTVRNEKRELLKALMSATRLDKIEGDDEVTGMIDDLLQSPSLKMSFANRPTFHLVPTRSFSPGLTGLNWATSMP